MHTKRRRLPRESRQPQQNLSGKPDHAANPAARAISVAGIPIMLALLVLGAFSHVGGHSFIELDDPTYVTRNPHVLQGLSWEGVRWAFSLNGYAANWHPLTWLSHMLDVQFFGLRPGPHHWVNVALHLLNSVFLFELLRRATGEVWRCAFVAALFSVHPLHVESVAWVSERKDVLSTAFWIATTMAYLRYVAAPRPSRYILVIVLYTCGLMAKPMLVTLPLALLLLDYWPLGRFCHAALDGRFRSSSGCVGGLLLEKAPLVALSCTSSAITFFVQQRGGMVQTFAEYPFGFRAANAIVAYVGYLRKMVWPVDLAIPYVNADVRVPAAHVIGAAAVLFAITALALHRRSRNPSLLTGWLWYLGTLFPVIGLVYIADQTMADRYAYVSAIGIYIMVAMGITSVLPKSKRTGTLTAAIAVASIAVLCSLARVQVSYWRDDEALFSHAVRVTDRNWLAENALGNAFSAKGRFSEAREHFLAALRIRPRLAEAHNGLGLALAAQGKFADAAAEYTQALRAHPSFAEAHNNLGIALARQAQYSQAIEHFSQALALSPDFSAPNANWGNTLTLQGRSREAAERYREAIRLNPYDAESYTGLGVALLELGRAAEAIPFYLKAIELNPRHAYAHFNFARALEATGAAAKAGQEYQRAFQLDPRLAATRKLYPLTRDPALPQRN